MARRELDRRLKRALHHPPLNQISPTQRDELLAFVGQALVFDDLPGKWQAAIAATEAAERSTPPLNWRLAPSRRPARRAAPPRCWAPRGVQSSLTWG